MRAQIVHALLAGSSLWFMLKFPCLHLKAVSALINLWQVWLAALWGFWVCWMPNI